MYRHEDAQSRCVSPVTSQCFCSNVASEHPFTGRPWIGSSRSPCDAAAAAAAACTTPMHSTMQHDGTEHSIVKAQTQSTVQHSAQCACWLRTTAKAAYSQWKVQQLHVSVHLRCVRRNARITASACKGSTCIALVKNSTK
jgi:hypothetical protein